MTREINPELGHIKRAIESMESEMKFVNATLAKLLLDISGPLLGTSSIHFYIINVNLTPEPNN